MILVRRSTMILLMLLAAGALWAREPLHWSFEQPDEDWVASPLDPQTA